MVFLRPALFIILVILLIPVCPAQSVSNDEIFTLAVASPTSAKDVQVRYYFTGGFPGYGTGGYGTSASDAGNKTITTAGIEGRSAKTLKLIAYAPGCQFVTITVDDLAGSDRQGDFQCQKLPTIQLHGRVYTTDLGLRNYLRQKEWQIETLYVCSWAMSYFGIKDGSVSPLSLGKAPVAPDGSFTIELQDFTADPTWPQISKEAELMFFLKDTAADARVAPLVVPASHSGNLQVAASYPEVILEIPEM